MPKTTNARTIAVSPNGAGIRGASAFTQALGGGAAGKLLRKSASPQERKNARKADRLFKEADRATALRRYRAAEKLYDEAIELLQAPPVPAWINRLGVAAKAANHDYVADNYKRIRAMARTDDERALADYAWTDCLMACGYLREALQLSEFWADRKTRSSASLKSMAGVIHAELGDLDKAIATQKSILEANPSHALARWHLALHQLTAGDVPAAFENYEGRWNVASFPSERRTFDIPRWNGEDPAGKRFLVWREQGIGDEIRFAGVLPDLVAAGAAVTFECSAKLVPLFAAAFPEIDVRARPQDTGRKTGNYGNFDYEVAIGSLARVFRPTVAQMQARCRPWLKRDTEFEDAVRKAMNAAPHQPIIGLCWRSSNRNMHRNQHYLKPEDLAAFRLLGQSGFVCLQYDECRSEVGLLRELGLPLAVFSSIDQMNDLVSASHLAGACDLVISAGTAVAELSAGLGVPTLMFGQPNSQIRLGTDGVPWHPATRYLTLDPEDPMAVARTILLDWDDIAAWAEKNSISGRSIDWRLSSPAAA